MATITVGGLATGLDTNKIIDQLVALEHRPIDLLETARSSAQAKELALQTFNTKVLAFLSAVDDLRDANDVLLRKASSSNEDVLGATASAGATAGTTTITVGALARNAIATAATGVASADASVSAGAGSFSFQVGTGATQTVALSATTTLQQLATAINDLDAGATATVVNLGTTAAPDYRLQLTSDATGTSHDLTIASDGTTLGVAVTQTAQNASFTLSGFTDPVVRESNTVGDLLPGVTLTLRDTGGPVTVAVSTDTDAVTTAVQTAVKAFNDIAGYVADESVVTQDTTGSDRQVQAGPLAFDGTVRNILTRLHDLVSGQVSGLPGRYNSLGQVGLTTNRDGTLALDATKLTAALADDAGAVSELFGGTSSVGGVADRLHDFLAGVTQVDGLISLRSTAVSNEIKRLNDDIASGQRNLDQFEATLRARFASLEVLVSSLQSQGAFLQKALGGTA
jgi:flagellar hook-associated protein 2